MHRVRRGYLIAGILVAIVFASHPVHAQFTANFQTNIISGVTNNWSGIYIVGSNTFADVLQIQNSGVLNCFVGQLGREPSRGDNNATVVGTGSIWNCSSYMYVGLADSGNSLVISNGGSVISHYGSDIGFYEQSSNNSAIVTDPGTFWDSGTSYIWGTLAIGEYGSGNSLLISNGAKVTSFGASIGAQNSSSNNVVKVTGNRSTWTIFRAMGLSASNVFIISSGGNVTTGDEIFLWLNRNAILVADTASSWHSSSNIYIGYGGIGNSLIVSNGGQVVNEGTGYIGFGSGASSNTVLVTGSGSVWSTHADMYVGSDGSFNSLVVSDGGRVTFRQMASLSNHGNGNNVIVTGLGSVWSGPSILVGYFGSDNSLMISNRGQVVITGSSIIGVNDSHRNSVRVVDSAVWNNNSLLVGNGGKTNSLTIDGGAVLATAVVIGVSYTNCTQFVRIDNGILVVTNASGNASLEVRGGKLIVNGGTLQVDRFVMTNACAQFVRNGGTLIYGTAVLDPTRDDDGDGMPNGWEQSHGLDPLNSVDANVDSDGDGYTNLQEFQAGSDPEDSASSFRITRIAAEGDDLRVTWMMGSGKTNALQAAAGDGGYYTNGFADIFTITNTVGSETNYLDIGAATNAPGRFYRVRLVP